MQQVDLAQQPDVIRPRPELPQGGRALILSQEIPVRIQPPLRPRTTGRSPTRTAGTGPAPMRRPAIGVTGISSTWSPNGSPGSSWIRVVGQRSDSVRASDRLPRGRWTGRGSVSGRSRMRPLLAASARCRSDVACSVRISRNAVMAIAKTCLQLVTTGQLQTPFNDVTSPDAPCTTVAAQVYGHAIRALHPAADPKRVVVQRNLDDGTDVDVVRRPGEGHPIGQPRQAQGGDPRAVADGGPATRSFGQRSSVERLPRRRLIHEPITARHTDSAPICGDRRAGQCSEPSHPAPMLHTAAQENSRTAVDPRGVLRHRCRRQDPPAPMTSEAPPT